MAKNKFFKIVISIIIAIAIFMLLSNLTFVSARVDLNAFDNTVDSSNATNTVAGILGTVINVIQVIATGIAVLMIVIIAIKWIYASPKGKADIANYIKMYVLGVILIFAAVGLLQAVKNFAVKNINGQLP